MNFMSKLKSLTIFFPFFNDEGTVLRMIENSYKIGHEVSEDLEVIAIHGGNSKDRTFEKILEAKKLYPNLVIIDKKDNKEGYAVIKHGFEKASKEFTFYTDGDGQYDLKDLKKLINIQLEEKVDVINGFKLNRGDGVLRFFLGDIYAKFSSFIFELPIRDTDCDFRLIRTSFLKKIKLESQDSSILVELIKKLEIEGASFKEIGVNHFDREYGKSNYNPLSLLKEKLVGDFKLYLMFKNMSHLLSKLRIIKFSMVGVSSVSIQILIFNLLIFFFQINSFVAVILADQIAIVNSFIFNNLFTFKENRFYLSKKILKPFMKFYLIVSLTTLIQAGIVFLGNFFLGNSLLISNFFFLIGLIIAFFINYKLQKKLVWNY